MPNTIYDQISKAFASKLKLINSNRVQPIEIAYENDDFEPTAGKIWIAQYDLPFSKQAEGMAASDSDRYDGLYQVSVFYPSSDITARFQAMEIASDIENLISRGTKVTHDGESARVIKTQRNPPFRGGIGSANTNWVQIIIEFYYVAVAS